MKNSAAPAYGASETGPAGSEGRTRDVVARLVLEAGPISAATVAQRLGLSAAAVRRHLDSLVSSGEAEGRDAPRLIPRGRGRPAKQFVLTETGRSRFGHAYDDLAAAALDHMAQSGGRQAVHDFARARVAGMLARHADTVRQASTVDGRTEALAALLSREGYAASTDQLAGGSQLCQHHCPVAHVAARHPELCEAEAEVFASMLGTHVQRLATIANGDAVCTTHIPHQTDSEAPTTSTRTEGVR